MADQAQPSDGPAGSRVAVLTTQAPTPSATGPIFTATTLALVIGLVWEFWVMKQPLRMLTEPELLALAGGLAGSLHAFVRWMRSAPDTIRWLDDLPREGGRPGSEAPAGPSPASVIRAFMPAAVRTASGIVLLAVSTLALAACSTTTIRQTGVMAAPMTPAQAAAAGAGVASPAPTAEPPTAALQFPNGGCQVTTEITNTSWLMKRGLTYSADMTRRDGSRSAVHLSDEASPDAGSIAALTNGVVSLGTAAMKLGAKADTPPAGSPAGTGPDLQAAVGSSAGSGVPRIVCPSAGLPAFTAPDN